MFFEPVAPPCKDQVIVDGGSTSSDHGSRLLFDRVTAGRRSLLLSSADRGVIPPITSAILCIGPLMQNDSSGYQMYRSNDGMAWPGVFRDNDHPTRRLRTIRKEQKMTIQEDKKPKITDSLPRELKPQLIKLQARLDKQVPPRVLDRNLLIATWNIRPLERTGASC